MRLSHCLAVASLLLPILPGCAETEEGPAPFESEVIETRYSAGSVVVDQAFSDHVKVEEDRLVISEAHLAGLDVAEGAILVGQPSSDAEDDANPLGFLRRVTSVERSGADVVIHTERAELGDWLEEADIDFGDVASAAPGGLSIRAKDNKDEKEASGASSTSLDSEAKAVEGSFKVTGASLALNAKLSGHFKVKRKGLWKAKIPVGLDAGAKLTLDPTITAGIEAKLTGQKELSKTWEPLGKKGVKIRLGAPGGIPLTVSFKPEIECTAKASGAAEASVKASISSHAVAGFAIKAGLDDIDFDNLSEAPTLPKPTLDLIAGAKVAMVASCKISMTPTLTAFEGIMLKVKLTKNVSLTAEACADLTDRDLSVFLEHDYEAIFGARVEIPVIHKGKDFELLGLKSKKGPPKYLVGDGRGCSPAPTEKEKEKEKTIDSCDGQPDGFYCSALSPYAGFVCKGGSVSHGLQCAPSQRCVGGDSSAIKCE